MTLPEPPPASPETAPAPKARPRALRLIHSISLVATLVVIWWTAGMGKLYASTFADLSMTALPFPTEVVLKMSDIVMRPEVLILGGLIGLALILLGHFGFIDRALPPLIVTELVVIALLVVGWWIGLQVPMLKIQENLSP